MPPRWSVTLHPDPIGIHTWSIWAGLTELARRGEIELACRDCRVPADAGVWLVVRDIASGERRTVLVDVGDPAGQNAPMRAALADSVWKRSYQGGTGRPLGLVAGMRSGHESLARYAVRSVATAAGRRSVSDVRRAVSGVADARRTLRLDRYGQVGERTDTVLYQVTAWDPAASTASAEREAINESRAAVIRALREAFGDRFVGGFVDTSFAREHHPDLVSKEASVRGHYVSLMQSCGVAVSTVGLHGSNPWKMAEYLATGCAIVSEPLRGALPEPVDAAVRWFESPDECVRRCEELLADPAARAGAQLAARRHWHEYTRPDRLVARRLAEEFDGPLGRPFATGGAPGSPR